MPQKRETHVTLQQVARHAGVSRATASLAVRGSQSITEATRKKVLDSMQELGYVYDRVAANLRSKTSSTVGLIIMELANPFYSELLVGIHQEFHRFGQTVILGTTFDSTETQDRLLATMLEHRVGGIILSAVSGSQKSAIEKLQYWNIPVVLVGRKVPDAECDYVGIDNVRGAKMAVDYLIGKGHCRIGFLGGVSRLTSWQERKYGYDMALREADIPADPALIAEGPAIMQSGVNSVEKLLGLPHPPTAIFCYNDIIAIGAMMKLKELNLIPGQDIDIVGFDDIPEAAIFSPKLTTVSSSIRRMGIHAANLLHERMEGLACKPQSIILSPELIIRESSSLQLQLNRS